jgi:hypothetical protein
MLTAMSCLDEIVSVYDADGQLIESEETITAID